MDISKLLFMILRNIKKFVMKNLSGELTFLEFKCLKIAYMKPITQKEIVEKTGLTKGTISKTLKSLEEKGLIVRKRKGKEYKVELTESGYEMIKKFEKIASKIDEILLKDFDERERKTLKNFFERMLRNIEREMK